MFAPVETRAFVNICVSLCFLDIRRIKLKMIQFSRTTGGASARRSFFKVYFMPPERTENEIKHFIELFAQFSSPYGRAVIRNLRLLWFTFISGRKPFANLTTLFHEVFKYATGEQKSAMNAQFPWKWGGRCLKTICGQSSTAITPHVHTIFIFLNIVKNVDVSISPSCVIVRISFMHLTISSTFLTKHNKSVLFQLTIANGMFHFVECRYTMGHYCFVNFVIKLFRQILISSRARCSHDASKQFSILKSG